MPRLMSTRFVVTSLPSTTMPGVTYMRVAPFVHRAVVVIADVRILERTPAAQQDPPPADLFVPGQRLVPEVEQVFVQRQALLHELDVPHQAYEVVGEELHGGNGADAAGIKRRGMNVPAFHQAEHLARHAADLQRLAIEVARERVEGPHDVADGFVAVDRRHWALRSARPFPRRRGSFP